MIKRKKGSSQNLTENGLPASPLVYTVRDQSARVGAEIARERGTTPESRAEFSRSFTQDARERSERLIRRVGKGLATAL